MTTNYYKVEESGSIQCIPASLITKETPKLIYVRNMQYRKEVLFTDLEKAKQRARHILEKKLENYNRRIEMTSLSIHELDTLSDAYFEEKLINRQSITWWYAN